MDQGPASDENEWDRIEPKSLLYVALTWMNSVAYFYASVMHLQVALYHWRGPHYSSSRPLQALLHLRRGVLSV